MKEKKSKKANADKNSVLYRLAGGLLSMLIIAGFLQLNFAFKLPEPKADFEEDMLYMLPAVVEPAPTIQNVKKAQKPKPKLSTTVSIALEPIPEPLINAAAADESSLDLVDVPDFANLLPTEPYVDYSKVMEDFELDKAPTFPGGDAALRKWLFNNLEYPASCQRMNLEGAVLVEFVVDKSGQVIDVKLLLESNAPFNREALRTVGRMPNWQPGVLNGHPVKCKIRLPINFVLR